jgi:hypothetical protein
VGSTSLAKLATAIPWASVSALRVAVLPCGSSTPTQGLDFSFPRTYGRNSQ